MVKALDKEGNKTVAIKIQKLEGDQTFIIDDEYRILRDYADHRNLPNFYGVYRKRERNGTDEIWFVLEVSTQQNDENTVFKHFICFA